MNHTRLALLGGWGALSLLGCQGPGQSANPFLQADRVPPPATRSIAPGTAQPYYQGDPLPMMQGAPPLSNPYAPQSAAPAPPWGGGPSGVTPANYEAPLPSQNPPAPLPSVPVTLTPAPAEGPPFTETPASSLPWIASSAPRPLDAVATLPPQGLALPVAGVGPTELAPPPRVRMPGPQATTIGPNGEVQVVDLPPRPAGGAGSDGFKAQSPSWRY